MQGALTELEAVAVTCALARRPCTLRLLGGGSSRGAASDAESTTAASGSGEAEASSEAGSGLEVVPPARCKAARTGGEQPKKKRSHWVVSTGNSTSFNSAKGVLEAATCDVLGLQETKLATHDALTSAA